MAWLISFDGTEYRRGNRSLSCSRSKKLANVEERRLRGVSIIVGRVEERASSPSNITERSRDDSGI